MVEVRGSHPLLPFSGKEETGYDIYNTRVYTEGNAGAVFGAPGAAGTSLGVSLFLRHGQRLARQSVHC